MHTRTTKNGLLDARQKGRKVPFKPQRDFH